VIYAVVDEVMCSCGAVVEVESETQWWPSQSRKESIQNYLLIEKRGLQNGEAEWGG